MPKKICEKKDDSFIYELFMLASTMFAVFLVIATDMDIGLFKEIDIPRSYISIPLVIIYIIFIIKSIRRYSTIKAAVEYEYDTEIRAMKRISKSANNFMKRK